ncbi:MAG: hypothetical protein U1D06_15100 [Paracoccaceae bacterium]|nr:hypothetical protein [Paracoccaceae bacterium]
MLMREPTTDVAERVHANGCDCPRSLSQTAKPGVPLAENLMTRDAVRQDCEEHSMTDQNFVRLVRGAVFGVGLAVWGFASIGVAHVLGVLA